VTAIPGPLIPVAESLREVSHPPGTSERAMGTMKMKSHIRIDEDGEGEYDDSLLNQITTRITIMGGAGGAISPGSSPTSPGRSESRQGTRHGIMNEELTESIAMEIPRPFHRAIHLKKEVLGLESRKERSGEKDQKDSPQKKEGGGEDARLTDTRRYISDGVGKSGKMLRVMGRLDFDITSLRSMQFFQCVEAAIVEEYDIFRLTLTRNLIGGYHRGIRCTHTNAG